MGLTGEYFAILSPPVDLGTFYQTISTDTGCVPNGFNHSYIVHISKVKDTHTEPLTCSDFRGIAIVISKVFEYCVIDHYKEFLSLHIISLEFEKD